MSEWKRDIKKEVNIVVYLQKALDIYQLTHRDVHKAEMMLAVTQLILVEAADVPSKKGRKETIETTCKFLTEGLAAIEKAGVCVLETEGSVGAST